MLDHKRITAQLCSCWFPYLSDDGALKLGYSFFGKMRKNDKNHFRVVDDLRLDVGTRYHRVTPEWKGGNKNLLHKGCTTQGKVQEADEFGEHFRLRKTWSWEKYFWAKRTKFSWRNQSQNRKSFLARLNSAKNDFNKCRLVIVRHCWNEIGKLQRRALIHKCQGANTRNILLKNIFVDGIIGYRTADTNMESKSVNIVCRYFLKTLFHNLLQIQIMTFYRSRTKFFAKKEFVTKHMQDSTQLKLCRLYLRRMLKTMSRCCDTVGWVVILVIIEWRLIVTFSLWNVRTSCNAF